MYMNDTQAAAFLEAIIGAQKELTKQSPKESHQAMDMGHSIVEGFLSVSDEVDPERVKKLKQTTSFGDAYKVLVNDFGVKPSKILGDLENFLFTLAETPPLEHNGVTLSFKDFLKHYKRIKLQFIEYQKFEQEMI